MAGRSKRTPSGSFVHGPCPSDLAGVTQSNQERCSTRRLQFAAPRRGPAALRAGRCPSVASIATGAGLAIRPFRAEALEGEATRVLLAEHAPQDLDWVFISPAGAYGAWVPGERIGTYRVGGEVALLDAEGGSNLSGADFAIAIVDEIENAPHHREHIGIAY